LADTDARWNIIAASVDDRTPAERGEVPGVKPIAKSRYDSISTYISPFPTLRPEYNDLDIRTDQKTYDTLIEAGMDDILAKRTTYPSLSPSSPNHQRYLQISPTSSSATPL
jgi:glutamate--cysteine ligase catalytic subunit